MQLAVCEPAKWTDQDSRGLEITEYQIQIMKQTPNLNGPATRADTGGRLIENEFSCLSQRTCMSWLRQ